MLLILELVFIVFLFTVLVMLKRKERTLSKALMPRAKVEEYWDGRERRRYVRFKKALDVNYKVERAPHLRKNSKTVDISERGAKLLLDEKLPVGTILDMQFEISDSKGPLELEGEIVWSKEIDEVDVLEKRLFHSGIKFLPVKEPIGTKLADYIYSLASNPED